MISTKGRYALKVMVELAEHDAEEIMPCHFRSDIRGWKQYKEDTADYS